MPMYLYECECGFSKDIFHSMKMECDYNCEECGKKMYRVITGGTGFIISESNDPISPKPDSYWKNAEENRLKSVKRRRAEEREKIRYGDRQTLSKLENRATNMKNLGKKSEYESIDRTLNAKGRG